MPLGTPPFLGERPHRNGILRSRGQGESLPETAHFPEKGEIRLVMLFPCDTVPVPAEDAPESWACHDGIGTTNFRHLSVDQQYPSDC
jgi:hypothetical protein